MATNPSLLIVPYRFKAAKLYSQLPESGAGDFVVTRATTALRTNASGFLESIASGVPRLDYPAFGGCPSLLIEPAATNLVLRSEEFDNAAWFKNNSTVTANATTAPNNTTTADKLIENATNNTHSILPNSFPVIVSGTTYTMSTYAKAAERTRIYFRDVNRAFGGTYFDLSNGTIISNEANVLNSAIEAVGNGWYRCQVTYSATSTSANWQIRLINTGTNDTYLGDGTSGVFLWGAQLEAGNGATSYIPTVATSITRNADVISVASVSGLIGQTQGTLYAEVNVTKLLGTQSRYILNISDGTANNRIYLAFSGASSNVIRARVWNGNVLQASIDTTTISTLGTRKLAIAYANNDIVFYMNGVQIGTDTSATIPACNRVNLGSSQGNIAQVNDPISAAAIYTSRLSNAQLESLTTL